MNQYDKDLAIIYAKKREEYQETDEELIASLKGLGLKNKAVLDFGCGGGSFSFRLAELGAEGVTGIDLSESMLEIANDKLTSKGYSNLKFIQADGAQMPFEDSSFELVLSNFSLVHFKDMTIPLKEIYRVLKVGGIIVATINVADFVDGYSNDEPIPLRLWDDLPVKDYIRTDSEAKNHIKDSGLFLETYELFGDKRKSIDQDYKHKDQIKNFHSVQFLASKR